MSLSHASRRTGISFLEICIAMALFALIMVPVMRSYFHSASIVRVSEREFQILNLGSSFTAQMKQLRRTQLAEADLPDFRLDDPDQGLVGLPGAGNPVIRLPRWNSDIIKVSYRASRFSPGDRFGGAGDTGIPLLIELSIAWKETLGGPRSARFGVLLP